MAQLLIQILGWVGAVLVVFAYAMVSSKKLQPTDPRYQWLNLIAAVCVGVNVFYLHAWPALAIQYVWGLIALLSLGKTLLSKPTRR